MTPGELALLLTAIVGIGGFFLSMRSTSYNELKTYCDILGSEFAKYKKTSEEEIERYKKHITILETNLEAKDKQIDALEDMNRALMNQNDSFKRYIVRLIRQLERAEIIPEKMDTE